MPKLYLTQLQIAAQKFTFNLDDAFSRIGFDETSLKKKKLLKPQLYTDLAKRVPGNVWALYLIEVCKTTNNIYLEIGKCGLTSEDFAENSPIDLALRQCKHLEILILSNTWMEDSMKPWAARISINGHDDNELFQLPNALNSLGKLKRLIASSLGLTVICNLEHSFKLQFLELSRNRIREINGLNYLTSLQKLLLWNNEISQLEGLENLVSLQLLELSSNKIIQIKGLENLSSLEELHLSNNKINELKGLDKLVKLKSLFLYDNLISNVKGLDGLISLQSLLIGKNKISEIKGLENLVSLQSLNFRDNKISEIKGLNNLAFLESIDLTSNKIRELKGFDNLTSLKSILLSNNEIREINGLNKLSKLERLHLDKNAIREIKNLPQINTLQSLSLSNNNISELTGLEDAIKLTDVDISSNKIRELKGLEHLINLTSLSLNNNKIRELNGLNKLIKLRHLFLYENEITQLKDIENLKNLQTLDLDHNFIKDISSLRFLKNLKNLFLKSNQVSEFKELYELTNLEAVGLENNLIKEINLIDAENLKLEFLIQPQEYFEYEGISLSNNPIISPPIEVVEQGRDFIIEFLKGEAQPVNECKLIFVGDGSVGKTSLMRRVVYGTYNEGETTTHGINKIAWRGLKKENGETIQVNLWDFGGQHIQHSLHQFFFTKRVIYVLVLNPRNDDKAHYWLDQIDKLGCESTILVVYNWRDEKDKKADFLQNFYELRKKYPQLPPPFLLSCKTNEGVAAFVKQLKKEVINHKGLNTPYRKEWYNIKKRLEEGIPVATNYINYSKYEEWCDEEAYFNPEHRKNLLITLNNIGSIVFFDKPVLNQLQVLNPEWISTGAYAVLTAEQTRLNKGHLSWNDLKEIFKDGKEVFSNKTVKILYTEQQFHYILQLMVEYGLCQQNPLKEQEYLIPAAFGPYAEQDYSYLKNKGRQYRIQFESAFEMLIIHRFIARNILHITGKSYWHSGIYFKHTASDTFALVETDSYSFQINCWIQGENVRGLWEVVRNDFRDIFKMYHNFPFKEEVRYVKSGKEMFLSYQEMLSALRNGQRIIDYHPVHQINNIDVLDVLELFEETKNIKEKVKKRVNEKLEVNVAVNPIFQNNPSNIISNNNSNTNSNSIKVDLVSNKELAQLKELILDLEEYQAEDIKWKENAFAALKELNEMEIAKDKASQKVSISKIDRFFKRMKDIKDWTAIGLLPAEIATKGHKMIELWEGLKHLFL